MASRRRTYVWRTLFATLLLGLVFWNQVDRLQRYSSPLQLLGSGRWVFQSIISWLSLAAFFGMPLLTCGCIVSERDRNTLSVLLTTQVSPWSLVIQKLAARLYVMLTLVLVSLPLMALAYSMGGVTSEQIVGGVVAITSLSVLTGSFALFQSVRSASAVGALASTLVWMSLTVVFISVFAMLTMTNPAEAVVLFAVFASVFSLVLLLAAADRLPQTAIDPPRNRLLNAFRRIDIFFRELNTGSGEIERAHDRTNLPDDEPLYWRERYKRALGQTHHLAWIVALVEIPTMIIVSQAVTGSGFHSGNPLGGFLDFLWIVAVLIVATRTVGIWPLERSRETLDVLLTTPLSARELLDQTMRGIHRTMIAVAFPIMTVQFATFYSHQSEAGHWHYLAGSLLAVVTVLPVVAWGAMLISLRVRSQLPGTLLAGVLIFANLFLVQSVLPESSVSTNFLLFMVRAAIDPGLIISATNWLLGPLSVTLPRSAFMLLVLGALASWNLVLARLIRWLCLRNLSGWLGRNDESIAVRLPGTPVKDQLSTDEASV